MKEKQSSSRISKIDKKKHDPWNRQAWIQKTLHDIQQRIAEQAHSLRKGFLSQAPSSQIKNAHKESLNQLKMQQSRIRQRLREIKSLQKRMKPKTKSSHNFVVKSNSQLRKLTKKYRDFKENLLEKSRVIQQQEQEDKIRTASLKEEHMKTQCKERRQKIEETLKQMQIRRKKRLQDHETQKQKLKELKKQKLFEKMNENWNKKQNELNEQMKQNYEVKKKAFDVNMSTLSTHEKQYDQTKEEKQDKRTLRMSESRLMLPPIQIYRSKYFDNVVEYDRQEKQRRQEQLEQKRNLKKIHKQFQQKIKSQFAPALKQKSESSEQDQKYALDRQQTFQKGNQYLKQSKKWTIPQQKRQEHQKKKALKEQAQNQIKPYRNYISEVFEKTDIKKDKNNLNPSLRKLKNMIQNDSVDNFDKIEQVKGFVDQLTYTFESNQQSTQQQMMNKINAKIQLLQILN